MFNSRLLNLAGLVVALGMLAGLGGFYLVGQGIPVAPAFFLAVLATAVVMMVVDFRAGATVPAFGIAMFCIGALIGARAAVDLLPATSRWVVVPGAFIVEAALLVGIVRVYRMRLLRNRSRLRHEMAQQRGWRYLLRAKVPVPGPRSARRLRGLSTRARATTGRHVVQATVDGWRVTMFDRVPPGESESMTQSVWLLRLPLALPYLCSNAEGDGVRTENRRFARALLNSDARSALDELLGRELWIENTYLCTIASGRQWAGADAEEVADTIDKLAAIAERLPWPKLKRYARRGDRRWPARHQTEPQEHLLRHDEVSMETPERS